ncbi:unnamed protein product [Ixodes pacificus]
MKRRRRHGWKRFWQDNCSVHATQSCRSVLSRCHKSEAGERGRWRNFTDLLTDAEKYSPTNLRIECSLK